MASAWLGIATAPRDGTAVDLWVSAKYAPMNKPPHGYRVVDATWSANTGWTFKIPMGPDTGRAQPIEYDGPGAAISATHWMPIPHPPETEASASGR